MSDYPTFPKIPRLYRNITITEKIDGTNGLIEITHYTSNLNDNLLPEPPPSGAVIWGEYMLRAGSRTRWLSPGKDTDNFGFAAWVAANAEELTKLGPGHHYGEWWGRGIQRTYGLTERRFSLFNTYRWSDPTIRPACCHVVPVLYSGLFSAGQLLVQLGRLARDGSHAAPGYMNPEGIIIFHEAANIPFKLAFNDDAKG